MNLIYTGKVGSGSMKNDKPIYNHSERENFFLRNKISKVLRIGSSLKLCSLAEGLIDVYPRYNGTKEWDTAAAHIICKEAGCKITDIKTKKELVYNKKSIKNNFFVASRNDLSFL